MQLLHIPQIVCQVLIPHNPTHNVAGKHATPVAKMSPFLGRAHPIFIEVPRAGPPGSGKREGPPPLNKKGVPTLPFID